MCLSCYILTTARPLFSRSDNRQVTPDQLATLIRLQNDALLKVAAQVAGMHEMVERLRSEWNSRTGQDPFEVSVDHVLPEVGKKGACCSILPRCLFSYSSPTSPPCNT